MPRTFSSHATSATVPPRSRPAMASLVLMFGLAASAPMMACPKRWQEGTRASADSLMIHQPRLAAFHCLPAAFQGRIRQPASLFFETGPRQPTILAPGLLDVPPCQPEAPERTTAGHSTARSRTIRLRILPWRCSILGFGEHLPGSPPCPTAAGGLWLTAGRHDQKTVTACSTEGNIASLHPLAIHSTGASQANIRVRGRWDSASLHLQKSPLPVAFVNDGLLRTAGGQPRAEACIFIFAIESSRARE